MNSVTKQKIQGQFYSVGASMVGIMLGLLFGFLVLIIANPRFAIPGFIRMLVSPLTNGRTNIGAVLYYSTTYIFSALSVALAGKCGMFNIGVGGQFIIGSYMACLVGVRITGIPPIILVPFAILCAFAAGAVWGGIMGLLKSVFNISDVVVSILLNYIGLYLVNMLIRSTIYDSYGNRTLQVKPEALIPRIGFDKLFPNTGVDMGIIIAILTALIIYFILNKTTFGYEIKFCGYNPDAAAYAGINARRNGVITMAIAGALPAVAGAFWHLSSAGNYITVVDTIPSAPMNGMSAALLAMGNPLGVIFTSLFVAYITVGGFNLQAFGYVPEIVSIVTGAIIYCSAFVMVIRGMIRRVYAKFTGKRRENTNE